MKDLNVGDKIILIEHQGRAKGTVGEVISLWTGQDRDKVEIRYEGQTTGTYPYQDPKAMRKLTKLDKALK